MSCTTTTTVIRDFAFSPKETVIHFQTITPPNSGSGRSLTDKARYGQPTPLLTNLTMSPAPITPRKTPKSTRSSHARRSTLPGISTAKRPSSGMKRRQTDPGSRAGLGISGLTEWEQREEERERESRRDKNLNGFTRCGRHSDEWLFGGLSWGDLVKRVVGFN